MEKRMEKAKYRDFVITVSDRDNEKCDENWKCNHWTVTIKKPLTRKQMSFDVWGAKLVTTMKPLEALYLYVSDACSFMNVEDVEDIMNEFGYDDYKEAKKIFAALEKSYYKCRRFIGDDNTICDIANDLQEEWG